jgi:hypothetical protein
VDQPAVRLDVPVLGGNYQISQSVHCAALMERHCEGKSVTQVKGQMSKGKGDGKGIGVGADARLRP